MTPESPARLLQMTLRDTILHAALLADGARIPALHSWRGRCIKLVEDLQQGMRDAQYASADINEISLTQCVLLDEITLRSLSHIERDEWTRESLQFRFHRAPEGKAHVLKKIVTLSSDARCKRELLTLYAVLMELVFEGNLRDSHTGRQAIQKAFNTPQLDNSTTSAHVTSGNASFSEYRHSPKSNWSSWGAILAVVLAGTLWFAWNAQIEGELKRMASLVPGQVESGLQGNPLP